MFPTFLHPFLPQKKLFKAYDIRGDVTLFTDDFVWALARSFAKLFGNANNGDVVIGYDVRLHSAGIAQFLAYACHQAGLQVHWLGQVTTPIMAFMANEYTGNGLMVTASHSEKHINGIKWLVNGESPSSQDIQDLFECLADEAVILPDEALLATITHHASQLTTTDTQAYFTQYQSAIYQAIDTINQQRQPLTHHSNSHDCTVATPQLLVIDCMNGATSHYAKGLFEGLGYTCVMLNEQADGTFPKGNPDPTEVGRLDELCQAVLDYQGDMGLAFDGDGDRLMVVNRLGQVVSPDHLLYLLAKVALMELPPQHLAHTPMPFSNHQITPSLLPKAEVIFDVKCSHHIPNLIGQQGAIPVMEKTGSSLMRKSLQNKSRFSVFAGELSGHFLFNDGYFVLHDDAMYAGVRLLNWLQYQPQDLVTLLESLPQGVSTADMYLAVENAEAGQKIISNIVSISKRPFRAIKRSFAIKNINTIDGLRLDFAHGFGIVRKSNTGNFLTVRFSANTLKDLRQIQGVFVDLCRSVDKELAQQVAQIQPV
ncbi:MULTISPECIES: phosphomannomutase/phosphoglucomutase [unclassified Moraxella]|uniref:phosphomannomutase/phosphoglucomutase n=1 Tax=unclassified Moraxella TaxID=2685852 RepID=UPI003AF976AA